MTNTLLAPIAVALDAPDASTFDAWVAAVAPAVQCLKVGLEVICREGPGAIVDARRRATEVDRADIEMFVDMKLHDIPATVGKAARSLSSVHPTYLTVHAAGGAEMIAAAVQELPDTKITAVTVLTSLDAIQLRELGVAGSPRDVVLRWAELSVAAGAQALVCSPHEVAALRSRIPEDITLITPGVRPVDASADDQRRTATPQQALADGSDLLVIGRPITAHIDPGSAARLIAKELLEWQAVNGPAQ